MANRTHPLKSMASGHLKIKKGTRPVLILATHRHTTESVDYDIGPIMILNIHTGPILLPKPPM